MYFSFFSFFQDAGLHLGRSSVRELSIFWEDTKKSGGLWGCNGRAPAQPPPANCLSLHCRLKSQAFQSAACTSGELDQASFSNKSPIKRVQSPLQDSQLCLLVGEVVRYLPTCSRFSQCCSGVQSGYTCRSFHHSLPTHISVFLLSYFAPKRATPCTPFLTRTGSDSSFLQGGGSGTTDLSNRACPVGLLSHTLGEKGA